MAMTTTAAGSLAEDQALGFLEARGMKLITRNFRCKMGEIDLIMQHENTIVFVEVRLRQSAGYHTGAESITSRKISRLARTAEYYLLGYGPEADHECRFDVVSIGNSIDWIPDAFNLD
ncbi:MAG: YraN family protein [Pseudomonadales bacterium]|nr:YraN family protein [Pseudomonadales bacterium]